MKIDFVIKEDRIQVLSPLSAFAQADEIELGYIKDNAFFPNNAMMFKAEWLVEIAGFMQNCIDLPGIQAYYQINKDISL